MRVIADRETGQVQQELCGGEVEGLSEKVGFEAGLEYGEGGGVAD